MSTLRKNWSGLLIVSLGICAFGVSAAAQDNSQQRDTTPAPAFGQNAPVLNPDNPPISGLDEPGLKLKTATRSFIAPAIQIAETADTNENNQLGGLSNVRPVSHVLGALDLQQFWPKSDLFLEYLGGGAFETQPVYQVKQLQALGVEGVTRWRTGYVKVRDALTYVPDGSFDLGTAGGFPGPGIATGGLGTGEEGGGLPGSHFFGTGAFEAVGDIPRLANTAIVDVVQAINPRSAFTVAGAFSNAHFYDNCTNISSNNNLAPVCLINSDQTTVEGGYSHLISRHDQIAGIYAFQLFRFPFNSGGEIYNDVFNVRWSHTITGRLRLIVGAGPQYTQLQFGGSYPRWSFSGRASLRYEFAHSSLVANWEKYTSEGSGFFAGANTQLARLAYRRSLGRYYSLLVDLGYTHNTRLQSFVANGISAGSYDTGSAGAILRRHLGRTWDAFLAYRFNEVAFDVSCRSLGNNCNFDQRHRGTIGLEWHPKATRIE